MALKMLTSVETKMCAEGIDLRSVLQSEVALDVRLVAL
jgi:hypothetical protein